ncbi:MAG: LytR C-terminal domain-containing protein [Bacteroidota bacterium]
MKPRILVLSLLATLGSGCTSLDRPSAALQIEPVMSIRHGGPDAQSFYQLGRYYHGQQRLELAENAYLKALAVDERHVDAMNALGSLYAERGDLKRAAQMFEQVTAQAPQAAYLYNNLGFAYYLLDRVDDAYLAVRQALSLDQNFERAWANLERIIGRGMGAELVEMVKARRLDVLPASLASESLPGKSAGEMAGISREAEIAPKLALETELAPRLDVGVPPAGAANPIKTPPAAEEAAPPAVDPAAKVFLPAETGSAQASGPLLTVADHPLASPSSSSECPKDVPDGASSTPARLEISNGNGIGGFAKKYSAALKTKEIPVARITNFASFTLRNSVVEFQPGYRASACVLLARIGLEARMVAAIRARPRSDVRILLGRDALLPTSSGKV